MLKASQIWKIWDLMKIPAEALLKISQEDNTRLMKQHEEDQKEIFELKKQLSILTDSMVDHESD